MKTETELLRSVQSGDKEDFGEIIRRFEPLVESAVSRYITDETFSHSDRDDLRQEAAIALYNAAMSYDIEQTDVTFGLYAKICLSNSLNSALRRRKRQLEADKAQLTEDIPYQYEIGESDAGLLLSRIDRLLSETERSVLRLYLRGHAARSIADAIGKTERSVNNAIYRIRKKLTRLL